MVFAQEAQTVWGIKYTTNLDYRDTLTIFDANPAVPDPCCYVFELPLDTQYFLTNAPKIHHRVKLAQRLGESNARADLVVIARHVDTPDTPMLLLLLQRPDCFHADCLWLHRDYLLRGLAPP